jgi:hypothetical protein
MEDEKKKIVLKWASLRTVILPRIIGRVKSSDILFQKEEKGHAKGSKDLYDRV